LESDPVDLYVGHRIRLRRSLLGLSQSQLGRRLHLTFQQIQKYEKGLNRIGASRLYELSLVLDVPVSFFFEGAPWSSGAKTGLAEPPGPSGFDPDPLSKRETVELVRSYYGIGNSAARRKLFELTRAIAVNYGGEDTDPPGEPAAAQADADAPTYEAGPPVGRKPRAKRRT
jgi:transcriptional regulator with XRE-family HTH domain